MNYSELKPAKNELLNYYKREETRLLRIFRDFIGGITEVCRREKKRTSQSCYNLCNLNINF